MQWQILAALGQLDQAGGVGNKASEAFAQAAEIIQALAEKIENEELRAGFLATDQVRQVLEKAKL